MKVYPLFSSHGKLVGYVQREKNSTVRRTRKAKAQEPESEPKRRGRPRKIVADSVE